MICQSLFPASSSMSLSFVHFAAINQPLCPSPNTPDIFPPWTFMLFSDWKVFPPDIHMASSLTSFTSLTRCCLVNLFFPDHHVLMSKHTYLCYAPCSLPLFLPIMHPSKQQITLQIYILIFYSLPQCSKMFKLKKDKYIVQYCIPAATRIAGIEQTLNNYCLNKMKQIHE